MSPELRTALRRTSLENGRMFAVNVDNERNIWFYTSTLRLIAHFEPDAEQFAEACRWWVMQNPGRYRQIKSKRTPVNPPLGSIAEGQEVGRQPIVRQTYANYRKRRVDDTKYPITEAERGLESNGSEFA